MRAFFPGSIAFQSLARRVIVFLEAVEAVPRALRTAAAPCPDASAIAARATPTLPVMLSITLSNDDVREAAFLRAAVLRRGAAFRVRPAPAGLRAAVRRRFVPAISTTVSSSFSILTSKSVIPSSLFSGRDIGGVEISTGMSFNRTSIAFISGVAAAAAGGMPGERVAFIGPNLAFLCRYSFPVTALSRTDREALAAWFLRNRERSDALFDSVRPEAYEARPIALRNPICFYEGHLPAFAINTLVKRGLGDEGVDPAFEALFQRGIDPEDEQSVSPGPSRWPSRIEIRSYGVAADRTLLDALANRDIDRDENPVLRRGLAAYTILEHEAMHQETLHYIWHRLPYDQKVRPAGLAAPRTGVEPPQPVSARVPAGRASLGADLDAVPFAWDNELPAHGVDVEAFSIDIYSTTNRDFLEFVEAGGYQTEELWDEEGWRWCVAERVRHPLFWELHRGAWFWRGMWDLIPLPMSWPAYVTHAEAGAFARWKGRRLPTEAEFHRAAYGTSEGRERTYPWGEGPPDPSRGNFDFQNADPVPVGTFPRGASFWDVQDLVGNGWEWTSTVFAGFDGFEPGASYPEYSADFFDGKHWVLKGASPATAKELLRRSFRNWFRGTYPYVYAKFRTVGR